MFDVHAEYTEGNSSRRIERIGKKYQWIALYELLAKLADNFQWIDRNYDDLIDNEYYSTIQISKRDIDPTMWSTEAHYDCYERKEKTDAWHYGDYSYKMHIPYYEYIWENDARDYALEESVSCYIPSNVLMKVFNLHNDPLNYGKWYNNENNVIFMDPSVSEKGNGYALINSYYFNDWLKKNKLVLVWLVGGEKQVYHAKNHNPGFGVYGRVVFNMVFMDSDNGIERKHYDYYKSI